MKTTGRSSPSMATIDTRSLWNNIASTSTAGLRAELELDDGTLYDEPLEGIAAGAF